MRKILFLIILAVSATVCNAKDIIFQNGRTNYDIVICSGASVSEKTAASELSDYLSRISGVKFRLSDKIAKNRKFIYVGHDAFVARTLGAKQPDAYSEAFRWVTRNGNIFIFGGRNRGTMYGVYKFLEDELGVHWLTKDCTKVPSMKYFSTEDINSVQAPAFAFRQVLYYTSRLNHDWDAHNCVNFTYGLPIKNNYGGLESYFGVHTMGEMLGENYFSSHPEFFSLYKGKRIIDGQLCLSNPDVLKIIKEKTLRMIASTPSCRCYSVSQNDNSKFCECRSCKALEKRYGGHSGLLIWFVNQVADEVKSKYPNKKIGTLAYHDTQTPPAGIVPRKNVVIRMCDVECCLSHPISSKENTTFYNDLKGWKKLTSNIVIWDYATNFYHYLMPVPNISSVAANMRIYKSMKLDGVMEQGQYDAYGGEFYELKQWIFSHLLWNPYASTDSLARIFIYDYYGKGAEYVVKYYKLTQQLGVNNHFFFETRYDTPYYTTQYLTDSRRLLDTALKSAGKDSVSYRHLEELRASILYLQVMRNKSTSLLNGDAALLKQFFQKFKWKEREGTSYEEFIKNMSYW